MRSKKTYKRLDFKAINAEALRRSDTIITYFLPGSRLEGNEWIALNPNRMDRSLGSFKINSTSGRWADFATGDSGGDLISLLAYVLNCGQREAAVILSKLLGGFHDPKF